MAREKVWKVGLYIRLSRDDGKEESLSVVNQRKILMEFTEQSFPGKCLLMETYIDDGRSGTDDDRPDFQKMLRHVEEGRINCIICKNLSRMFRNYSDQGYFLEDFFPRHHTRFITLGDPKVDTFLNPEAVNGMEVPISGLMNDRFACRTSCDIRRTFDTKRRRGEFIGAFAPYGYRKDPENKNHLLIDPEAAEVVRNIFQWYAYGDGSAEDRKEKENATTDFGAAVVWGGMSKEGIARKLNEMEIPNPTAYKQRKGMKYRNPQTDVNDGFWQSSSIAAILSNEMYAGIMVQGRQKVISYKVHERITVPSEEWYRVAGVHEPVIEPELFDLVQEIQGKNTRRTPGKRRNYLFSGLLVCADCGKSMTRKPSKGMVYFNCSTYKRKSRKRCTIHSIRLDRLEKAVLLAVQGQLERARCAGETADAVRKAPAGTAAWKRREEGLALSIRELRKTENLSSGLYEDWKNGDLTRKQYHQLNEKYTAQIRSLEKNIERIRQENEIEKNKTNTGDPLLQSFLEYNEIRFLTQGLLIHLVNVIQVQEKDELTIVFRFHDPQTDAKG